MLVAAADPWLARLQADGSARWKHGPPQADFRAQRSTLAVSNDGLRVDFGFQPFGKVPARFDLASHTLTLNPPADPQMAHPRQDGLAIADWFENEHSTLAGQPLPLQRYETSRSLAIHPAGDRFVLGTEWYLRAFDAQGKPLWRRAVPGVVWAVNISGDGRLVVAAYGDGTIRWHRMSDGTELLALMPLPAQTNAEQSNWVAWTPEGFYAATPGANSVLRWQVNHGWEPAEAVPVADIPGSFRPAVLPLVLQELETPRALGLAELAVHNKEVEVRTQSGVPPGARLQLLTIGISAYNTDYAKSLRLQYADRDAQDLASALKSTQSSLYARVLTQVLVDKEANKAGILRALKTMRAGMQAGTGTDLAVVHFSGRGALIDNKLYLLPYEVDARDAVGIEANGLGLDEFRGELLELAKYGRVLVLLDACHSGATTMDGARLAMDATALRAGLAAANVTVLTSSSGHEVSREDPRWGHGAFTKVLLEALSDPAADPDHKGLINASGLAHYVATHVSSLTNGKQTPDMEVRFDSTVFASSLQTTINQSR
ncbi:MAG: caspase family protein [Rhodopila sp.]